MTPAFAELVKRVAKCPYCIYFEVTKEELLGFSEEERRFIEKYIEKYMRGSHRLQPRSIEHFVSSGKYGEEDYAVVYIENIDDLVSAGYLELAEIGGFYCWRLGNGEVLVPREYKRLYMSRRETFRTLLKEYGYLEIYEEFKDNIEPPSGVWENYVGILALFRHSDFLFELYEDHLIARADIDVGGSTMSVKWTAEKPTASTVHSIAAYVKSELVRRFASDIAKMREHVRSEIGVDVSPSGFRGCVEVANGDVREYSLSAEWSTEANRKTVTVSIWWYITERAFKVYMKSSIASQYLTDLFSYLEPFVYRVKMPGGYSIDISRAKRSISIRYSKQYEDADTLPPLSEPFTIVSNIERVLGEVIKLYLEDEENLNKKIVSYQDTGAGVWRYEERDTGLTVSGVLKAISWNPRASLDEAILKLIAAREELGEEHRPPVFNLLLAQLVLSGHSQDKIMERVNDPVETLLKYMLAGRLRVKRVDIPGGGRATKLYLDGRDIGVDVEMLSRFAELVETANALAKLAEVALRKRSGLMKIGI